MLSLSNLLVALFSLIMRPFASMPLFGMIVISVVTGVLMLIIYKYTSNQAGITRAKDRIKGNFLAIMLFSSSFAVLIKSIGSIFKWNLVYMAHNLKPLAVMIVPVLLLLVQLNFWYGYRPIKVGESVLVKAEIEQSINLSQTPVSMTTSGGVEIESPGVRAFSTSEVYWRIKGAQPGEHTLTMKVGDQTATKCVVVGAPDRLYRLAPLRHDGNFWDGLLYPGEKKLTGKIQAIELAYPPIEMDVFGLQVHWIIVYFVLSIIAGLSMKGVFKVDI